MTLRLADLSTMSESARNDALSGLVRRATAAPNGQLAALDAEIRVFEVRHGMISSEMQAAFKVGTVQDTAEIAQWLFLLQLRECVSA